MDAAARIRWTGVTLVAFILSASCAGERTTGADATTAEIRMNAFAGAQWSEPVHLRELSTTDNEQNAFLSKDELTIYFSSTRTPSEGGLDIWVARRASLDAPWGTPVNLGPPINGPLGDFAPNLSPDGHLLFFSSGRLGGHGGPDIYMSWRDDPDDDFGWSEPVNLGPLVNTNESENAPFYLPAADAGQASLYFNRGNLVLNTSDIYVAALRRTGEVLGPATLVEELSVPGFNDAAVSVRRDGREIFFWSNRPGSEGNDIWVSTRPGNAHQWGAPVNAGRPLNSPAGDVTPHLSFDGTTMIFGSTRSGGSGGMISGCRRGQSGEGELRLPLAAWHMGRASRCTSTLAQLAPGRTLVLSW